jgi:hypothetical protein
MSSQMSETNMSVTEAVNASTEFDVCECGAKFQRHKPWHQHCSHACRSRAYRKRRQKESWVDAGYFPTDEFRALEEYFAEIEPGFTEFQEES